jgi:hypothetical protein
MKEADIFIEVGGLWISYTYGFEINEARSSNYGRIYYLSREISICN